MSLQSKLDSLREGGGGILNLGPGTYSISAPLRTGKLAGVTIRGAGRGATRIVQRTPNVPVLLFDDESHDNRVEGLTLAYDAFEPADHTGSTAVAFDAPAGQTRMCWQNAFRDIAIERARVGVGYTGAGTVATYDMTWENVTVRSFSRQAFRLESPSGGLGQPGHAFRDILIEALNIVPTDTPALWFQGLTNATIDNLVVANTRNAVLYAFADSHIDIRGLHVEGAVITTNYVRMFALDDRGSLSIRNGTVEVTVQSDDTAWFAGASSNGNGRTDLTLRDLSLALTKHPGHLELVRCDDSGARIRYSGIDNVFNNLVIPFDPAHSTWVPQVIEAG